MAQEEIKLNVEVVRIHEFPNRPYVIALDFDDTIAKDAFPHIENGTLIQKTLDKMERLLKEKPHTEFILWTCREGERLQDAINFVKQHELPINVFNDNHPWILETIPESKHWRKIWADEYWDDKAVCPL